MTSRRPPGVSHETWVERQIREATERGAFDGLSAAGKPLDEASLTQSAGEWAAQWARREGADMSAALPLALALRIEREKLVDEVPRKPTERAVQVAVEEFNGKLDAAYRRPQEVPPVALAFVDLERQVARWREAHPEPEPAEAPAEAAMTRAERRWWVVRGLDVRRRRPRGAPGRPSPGGRARREG